MYKKKESQKSKCDIVGCFKRFDENTLRPCLIHKYNKVKKERDYVLFTKLRENINIMDHFYPESANKD